MPESYAAKCTMEWYSAWKTQFPGGFFSKKEHLLNEVFLGLIKVGKIRLRSVCDLLALTNRKTMNAVRQRSRVTNLQISSLWSSNQKPLETSPPPLELRHLTSISAAAHVPGAAALKLPSKPCKLERPSSLSPFSLSLLFSFLSSRLKERLQFSNHRNFSVFETRGKLWIFSHAQKTSKPKAWALNSTTNPTF